MRRRKICAAFYIAIPSRELNTYINYHTHLDEKHF